MKQTIFPIMMGAALLSAAGFHYWTKPPLANAVGLIDASGSMQRNCAAFAEHSKHWLTRSPGIGEGSKLTLMIMGLDAINPEPKPIFTKPIPVDAGIVIGGDREGYLRAQQELFGEVQHVCETAKAGRQSPIYQMVRQAIAVLRGPDGRGRGYILLQSDLDDDAHSQLSVLLRQAARNSEIEVPKDLAGSLDNTDIAIEVCGTADLAPHKVATSTASFDTRLRIWKALATHPELITTQPFCGAQ